MVELKEYKYVVGAVIYQSICGWLLGLAGFIEYTLITPVIFIAGATLLGGALTLADTPILKGLAGTGLAGWIIGYFIYPTMTLPLPDPFKALAFACLSLPSIIGITLTFMEIV